MKKIVLILVVLIFVGCSKDDNSEVTNKVGVASFKILNTNEVVNEHQTLELQNDSKNAVSYLWDFGNGDTSTEVTPNYTYPMCGYYTVKLTATDVEGNQTIYSQELPVLCVFGGSYNHPTDHETATE